MNKFDKVKEFYDSGLWSEGMVRNAVGRWITPEEFYKITEQIYEKKE